MELQSRLGTAVGFDRFNTNSPITEVAENSKKTVELLDKIQCNTKTTFNTNEQFVLNDIATLTFPAYSYHRIKYKVISGTATITEVNAFTAPTGYEGESVASILLANSITITGLSAGTLVIVKTLK